MSTEVERLQGLLATVQRNRVRPREVAPLAAAPNDRPTPVPAAPAPAPVAAPAALPTPLPPAPQAARPRPVSAMPGLRTPAPPAGSAPAVELPPAAPAPVVAAEPRRASSSPLRQAVREQAPPTAPQVSRGPQRIAPQPALDRPVAQAVSTHADQSPRSFGELLRRSLSLRPR